MTMVVIFKFWCSASDGYGMFFRIFKLVQKTNVMISKPRQNNKDHDCYFVFDARYICYNDLIPRYYSFKEVIVFIENKTEPA